MELRDRSVVITGAANGIGAALAARIRREQPRGLVLADIDESGLERTAAENGAISVRCDVGSEEDVQRVVAEATTAFGGVDVFISNAGITIPGGTEVSDSEWKRIWKINLMSRVYAARAVVPQMLERGEGYLVHTSSAAALLTEIGSAPYSVTKQADLALAEWLAVQYGRRGIRVSCLCPMGVDTDMLNEEDPIHRYLHLHLLTPEQVANTVVDGMREESFLMLPQPDLDDFRRLKTEDTDRWVRGMQRLLQKLTARKDRKA